MLSQQTINDDDELFSLYEKSPSAWMQDTLGVDTLHEFQGNIGEAIVKYDKVAIRAAHSLGKTWYMARVALWFLTNFKNSIVVTTAPTHRQVQKLLWGELRSAYKSSLSPLGGRLLDMELKFSDKHYAIGFSPQTKAASASVEQQGSSFQGFHSDYVLIIFDEATGVSADIWVMAQGLLTSGIMVKFVAIANPTTKACTFFSCFSSPEWYNMKINCFDSPNMIANGFVNKFALQKEIDRLSVLTDEERISVIQDYKKPAPYLLTAQFVVPYVMYRGMDHPLVLSKVLAEFPKDEDNVLVQYEHIMAAINREQPGVSEDIKRLIGVDVARFGTDKSVITELLDYEQVFLKALVKRDITYVTGEVINQINDGTTTPCVVCIDATGLGAGVYDLLVEAKSQGIIGDHVTIVEVHNGASPALEGALDEEREQDKARYLNLKSKQFDLLGDDLKERIKLMDESIYLEELPSIKYKFDSKGRIVIESKKDYKERTGRPSPDYSDSLALANYGRYVTIVVGSFHHEENDSEPMIRQNRETEYKSRIKATEY